MSSISGVGQVSQVRQALPPSPPPAAAQRASGGSGPATQVSISAAARQLSQATQAASGDRDHDGDSK